MEYSPLKFKTNMEKYGFNLKKKFGQNFIVDENTINKIIEVAQIDKDTLVIEIGPGAGSLTYKLAMSAKNVLCYEIDTTLKELLNDNLNGLTNVNIIYKDFLQCNVKEDIKKYDFKKLYVVANLPYYITTPIIMKFIEDEIPVDKLVVMVQKEVGDRFKAQPGTKDYNSLSIYLNYYFKVKREDEPELEEGTYYIVDLIGLDVYSDEEELLGKVDYIYNTGSSDIYVVKNDEGKEILLPAIKDVLKQVDLENKKIIVHIIEGLI